MMSGSTYNPRTIFSLWFLSLPCVSLLLALGTCLFAWSHGHTLLCHHSTCLEIWSGSRGKSLGPGVLFFSNHHGCPGAQPVKSVTSSGLWGSRFTMISFYRYRDWDLEVESNHLPQTLQLVSQSRVFAQCPVSLLLFPARFSVEYKYFSRNYSMEGTELLYIVRVPSWVILNNFLLETIWAFWISFILKALFSVT